MAAQLLRGTVGQREKAAVALKHAATAMPSAVPSVAA